MHTLHILQHVSTAALAPGCVSSCACHAMAYAVAAESRYALKALHSHQAMLYTVEAVLRLSCVGYMKADQQRPQSGRSSGSAATCCRHGKHLGARH